MDKTNFENTGGVCAFEEGKKKIPSTFLAATAWIARRRRGKMSSRSLCIVLPQVSFIQKGEIYFFVISLTSQYVPEVKSTQAD